MIEPRARTFERSQRLLGTAWNHPPQAEQRLAPPVAGWTLALRAIGHERQRRSAARPPSLQAQKPLVEDYPTSPGGVSVVGRPAFRR
jgi:hypothetical protein